MTAHTLTYLAAIGGMLASAANAHMIMAKPVPYGVSTLNNSPLVADYPCKQRAGVYDMTTMNDMAVGVPQTLSFTGSATHGGGTCQISVSLDPKPSAQSVFKIIHSIEGNCPGHDAGNGAPDTFQFKIPEGFPNGEFALAWTWFNKVGNREMYMNCAPINVTGGSDNHDLYNTLPDVQLANIPQTTCTTANDVAILPNPGKSLQRLGDGPFVNMIGDCGTPSHPAPGTAAGNDGKPIPGDPEPESSDAPSPSTSAPASSSTASVIPMPSEAPAAQPTQSPVPANFPTPDNGTTAGSSCGKDGTLVCNDAGDQFGLCNFGKVVFQPVAPGTQCKDGKITRAKRDRVGRGIAGRVKYVIRPVRPME